MAFLLLFILFILLIFSLKLIKIPPFFSASIVSISMLAFCAIFLVIDTLLFKFDITFMTVFVISGSSILFLLGELIGFYIVRKNFKYLKFAKFQTHFLIKQTLWVHPIISLLFIGLTTSILVLYLQLNRVYQVGESYSAKTVFEYLDFYRIYDVQVQLGQTNDDIAPLGNLYSLLSALVFSIFCCVYFLIQITSNSKLTLVLFGLYSISIISSAILTGGRTNLLVIIMLFLLLKIYVMQINGENWQKFIKHNILTKIGLGFGLLFFMYLLNYYRANGVEEISFFSFYESISRYLASSFVGLDNTLANGLKEYKYGQYTLPSIYLLLDKLNISKTHVVNLSDQFFNYRGERSNVYTALAKPYWDFGLFWLFLSRFLLGVFYGFVERLIFDRKKRGFFGGILLILLLWPVYMYPFDDLFISFQQFYFFYVLMCSIVLSLIIKKYLFVNKISHE